MFRIHEIMNTRRTQIAGRADLLVQCIQDCMICFQACTTGADACLSENGLEELRACIRAELDCADICDVTVRVLSRQTERSWQVMRAQIEACREAVRACAEECERHAERLEHCRICAEHCRRCEESCSNLLDAALPIPIHH